MLASLPCASLYSDCIGKYSLRGRRYQNVEGHREEVRHRLEGHRPGGHIPDASSSDNRKGRGRGAEGGWAHCIGSGVAAAGHHTNVLSVGDTCFVVMGSSNVDLHGLVAEEEDIDRTAAAVGNRRRTAAEVVVDCIRRHTAVVVVDYTRLLGSRLHRIPHRSLVDKTSYTDSTPGLLRRIRYNENGMLFLDAKGRDRRTEIRFVSKVGGQEQPKERNVGGGSGTRQL